MHNNERQTTQTDSLNYPYPYSDASKTHLVLRDGNDVRRVRAVALPRVGGVVDCPRHAVAQQAQAAVGLGQHDLGLAGGVHVGDVGHVAAKITMTNRYRPVNTRRWLDTAIIYILERACAKVE